MVIAFPGLEKIFLEGDIRIVLYNTRSEQIFMIVSRETL
jgi:hypothetical protein